MQKYSQDGYAMEPNMGIKEHLKGDDDMAISSSKKI